MLWSIIPELDAATDAHNTLATFCKARLQNYNMFRTRRIFQKSKTLLLRWTHLKLKTKTFSAIPRILRRDLELAKLDHLNSHTTDRKLETCSSSLVKTGVFFRIHVYQAPRCVARVLEFGRSIRFYTDAVANCHPNIRSFCIEICQQKSVRWEWGSDKRVHKSQTQLSVYLSFTGTTDQQSVHSTQELNINS